jgi:hypothetical protein
MAATVSAGSRWPDGSTAKQGNVVIWSGEDGPADTLVPRLEGIDEIAGKGLARRDDVYPLIAGLIRAERTQRLDRLSLQHLVIAMPYTTQFNNAYYFGIKLPRLAFIKGRGCEATEV